MLADVVRRASGGKTANLIGIGSLLNHVYHSKDGIAWEEGTQLYPPPTADATLYGLAYSPLFDMLMIGGNAGGNVYKSMDRGINWTKLADPIPSTHSFWDVHWIDAGQGSQFFAFNGTGGMLKLYLPATDQWVDAADQFGTSSIETYAYSPSLGIYVIGGASNKVASSQNSTFWTLRTSPFASGVIREITWVPEWGLFVMSNSSGLIALSNNGTTWAQIPGNSPFSTHVHTLVWSPELGILVGGDSNGVVATTPDGSNWTVQSTEAHSFRGGIWVADLGLFLMNAPHAVDGHPWIGYSSDGVSWSYSPVNDHQDVYSQYASMRSVVQLPD